MKDYARVQVASRRAWREWLREHHTQGESIWLVVFRKHHAKHLSYDAIVEEALCYGWIDSLPRALDDDRTMLLLSPRKAKSPWSRANKQRIDAMIRKKLMRAPGKAKIETAKADGSWTLLDDVENLIEPPDLKRALDRTPAARKSWTKFAPSSKKGILWWIKSAKRTETRARRIRETARLAAMGLRANFPEAREIGL
ncbi:MAG: YdeI/OmpD-associated family protein [Myxococcota bacterium]